MTDDKTAIRLVCPKFNGHKGKEFTAWKRQYLDGCHLKGDDDASYTDCYLGNDPQAGLSAAQLRRRTVRRRESAYFLIMHMDDDSLKEVLRITARGTPNGRDVWLALEAECDEATSALEVNEKILEFHSATIAKDIGTSPSSIR